jgi:hypothetical protein
MKQAGIPTSKTETTNKQFARYARAALLAHPQLVRKLAPSLRRPTVLRPTVRRPSSFSK